MTLVLWYSVQSFSFHSRQQRRNAFNAFPRASFYVASKFAEFHANASSRTSQLLARVRSPPICSRTAALRDKPTNSVLNVLDETKRRNIIFSLASDDLYARDPKSFLSRYQIITRCNPLPAISHPLYPPFSSLARAKIGCDLPYSRHLAENDSRKMTLSLFSRTMTIGAFSAMMT